MASADALRDSGRGVDQNRVGDHICYVGGLWRFRANYPGWAADASLDDIPRDLAVPPGVEPNVEHGFLP